jgi:poly(3-hydroxybutyrate) depolymerase
MKNPTQILTLAFVTLVSGLSALSLSACKTDYSDTECSGFLGCSGALNAQGQETRIGPPESKEQMGGGGLMCPGMPVKEGKLDITAVWKGKGCGKGLPTDPMQVETEVGKPTGYTQWKVMGTGATISGPQPQKAGPRTFWVRVPIDYDPNKPYRVVYIGQGCGGYKIANTNTLPLFKEALKGSEQAIYVALDIPENNVNMDCYDNRDGKSSQEWEAFELFHKVVDENYCVDNNRVYVSGYSTGGWLANMWGCYFGGGIDTTKARLFAPCYHIRGQAAVTGGEPTEQPTCNGPVAAIWIHDKNDNGNQISGNINALTRVGRTNGCPTNYEDQSIQELWHPEEPLLNNICKKFKNCPADYPVIFCTTEGLGHADQKERATVAFTKFFDELEPK